MIYYIDRIEDDCNYISLGNKGLGFATDGETIMICCALNSAGHKPANDWAKLLRGEA